MICPATLPKPGTKVDIVGTGTATVLSNQPAVGSALYGGSASHPLSPGFEDGCTLQVQYADGTTDTVSAAEAPPSLLDEAALPLVLAGYAFLLTSDGSSSSSSGSRYAEMRDFYQDELERIDEERGAAPPGKPAEWSGEYWGGSDESDGGDQAVRVTLNFKSNGRLTGRGRDDVDGSYRITSGRWEVQADGAVAVLWEETYDEGFVTLCMGVYDAESGKIDARFTSDRSVSGAFYLTKKPSIF